MNHCYTSNFEIHCILIVWGKVFLNFFVDVSLPSQLSLNNLSSLPSTTVYYIYTTTEGEKLISKHSNFLILNKVFKVQFIINDLLDNEGCNYEKMSLCHKLAIENAAKLKAGLIFLSPDLVYAHNVFKNTLDLINKGKNVILVLNLRLDKKKFLDLYEKSRFENFSIPQNELVKMGLESLHSYTEACFVKQNQIAKWPSHIYKKLDDTCVMAIGFHQHPFFVLPQNYTTNFKGTIDGDYLRYACPSEKLWHVNTNSDQICFFELSGALKQQQVESLSHTKKNKVQIFLILCMWIFRNTNSLQRKISKQIVFLHSSDFITENIQEIKRIKKFHRSLLLATKIFAPIFFIADLIVYLKRVVLKVPFLNLFLRKIVHVLR